MCVRVCAAFHQITLIVSILGTPEPKAVKGKKTRDYVAALPKKPKISFLKIFPKASPLACDLLDKLLQFEPENRYTVEQALRHPYLEGKALPCPALPSASFRLAAVRCAVRCAVLLTCVLVGLGWAWRMCAELHCEEDEPVCENFDHNDFYFEYLRTTTKDLRVLIHQEIVNNYKEDEYECKDPTPSINDFTSQVTPSLSVWRPPASHSLGPRPCPEQLKKDPKNGKKKRRKSF